MSKFKGMRIPGVPLFVIRARNPVDAIATLSKVDRSRKNLGVTRSRLSLMRVRWISVASLGDRIRDIAYACEVTAPGLCSEGFELPRKALRN